MFQGVPIAGEGDPVAHVVLDGHHKLQAAAVTGVPIRMVAFVMPHKPTLPIS